MADTLLEYLGQQRANRILLAVIDGQHHLADTAYVSEPGDVPANQAYAPIIARRGIPRIRREIQGIFDGRSVPSFGDLVLASRVADGVDLALADIKEQPVQLAVAGPAGAWPTADAVPLLTGQVGGRRGNNDGELVIEVTDTEALLRTTIVGDEPLPGNDGGTVPLTFGRVHNITPVLQDFATQTYRYHDATTPGHSKRVFDNGVELPLGSYTDDPINSTFTLNNAPAGLVTMDTLGHSDGVNSYNTTAEIIQELLDRAGINIPVVVGAGLSDRQIGLYIDRPTRLSDVITDLMRGALGWWGVDRHGNLVLNALEAPQPGGRLLDHTNTLGLSPWRESVDHYRYFSVLWRRNWTVQTVAAGANAAHANVVARAGFETTRDVAGAGTTASAPQISSYFDESAPAIDVLDRLEALTGALRYETELTVPLGPDGPLELGDSVHVLEPEPRDAMVMAVSDVWDDGPPHQTITVRG